MPSHTFTKIRENCLNISALVILVSQSASLTMCNKYAKSTKSKHWLQQQLHLQINKGIQYNLPICFFVVAFKTVSYVISVDVPGVFTAISGNWKLEKQFHGIDLKKSTFRKCAETVEKKYSKNSFTYFDILRI